MLYFYKDGSKCSLTYDSSNRLLSAMGCTYTYNAENTRIMSVYNSVETQYVYNTVAKLSQLLVKKTGTKFTKYVYGLGLIGEETNGAFKTYHFDYRGSTVALTNVSGNITDRFEYDTYGKLTEGNIGITPFLYNGRDGVITDENGLYYMRARYYSPDLFRFVNADIVRGTISDSTSLNRYAYVNGNPISSVDPTGLIRDRNSGGVSVNNLVYTTKSLPSVSATNVKSTNTRKIRSSVGRYNNNIIKDPNKPAAPYTPDDPEFKAWLKSEAEKYHSRYHYVSSDNISVIPPEESSKPANDNIWKRIKYAVTSTYNIFSSPLSGIDANISLGVGIGGELTGSYNGVSLSGSAHKKYTYGLAYEDRKLDIKYVESEGASIGVENFEIGTTSGTKHSVFDDDCTCTFDTSFVRRADCPANEEFTETKSSIGFTLGFFVGVGAEVSVSFDFEKWFDEIVDIYNTKYE